MHTKICGKSDLNIIQDGVNFGINNEKLTEVDTYKYLGLFIDNRLNFQPHHKKVTSQIQLKLNQFRK